MPNLSRKKPSTKLLLTFLFSFLFLLASPSPSHAADYIVAKDGSGNFTTIQAGVNAAHAGDTVYVKTGTYREKVNISRSGTASNPITISTYAGEKPIIVPSLENSFYNCCW